MGRVMFGMTLVRWYRFSEHHRALGLKGLAYVHPH
jgi:hypothetical protein